MDQNSIFVIYLYKTKDNIENYSFQNFVHFKYSKCHDIRKKNKFFSY